MFEGLVASILNKWLRKYVEDLDTEHLNVGIFSGEVRLFDLHLKPEALYELELPIEVRHGVIGQMCLTIPWTSLSSQAVVVSIEDVYVVANPVGLEEFDPERERRLLRSAKKKVLEDLDGESVFGSGSGTFLEGLLSALANNIRIFVRNVHVRYEDPTCIGGIASGVCIQGMSIETTNSKWKPCTVAAGAATVYQLARLEAMSVYFNTSMGDSGYVGGNWQGDLKTGMQNFNIQGKEFDFLVKPLSAKMKVIVSRSGEARVPKLLVDLVVQDAAVQLSKAQFHSVIAVCDLFNAICIRRNYLRMRPRVPAQGNTSLWWKYSYKAVLEQRVHPYTWNRINEHREHYREYKELYRQVALNPGDTELKLDLSRAEDNLPLSSIVIAREHAKIEIKNEDPDRIEIISNEEKWWSFSTNGSIRFQVRPEKPRGLWSQLSPPERQRLNELLGRAEGDLPPEKKRKYIEHKVNITVHNLSASLFARRTEIASLNLTQFLGSFESRPAARAFKFSARAESLVVEGASIEHGLVPLLNADNVTGNSSSNFLYIDFEKNPLTVDANYGITVNLEPVEVIYHEHAVSEFLSFFQGVGVSADALKSNLLDFYKKALNFKKMVDTRQIRIDVHMSIKAPHVVIAETGSLQKAGMVVVIDLGKWTFRSDLQPPLCLEDVTQMELEERLYDRLHINLDGFQLLFSDSGDEWRESLKSDDTEYHVLSKIRGHIVLSNSIKPDYSLLPRTKLNVTASSIKLNLSDRRIVAFLDFLEGLPLPSSNTVSVAPVVISSTFQSDIIAPEPNGPVLYNIINTVISAELSRQRTPDYPGSMRPSLGVIDFNKHWSSVDASDEDVELWARTVDLPGFDDNVSPNNIITSLLRVVIGEVVLSLSRSSDLVDKPYLMARLSKFRFDSAFMQYGPAVQATLGGVQLIDKLHIGPSGEYLEIVSTQSDADFVSLLYRKVRADCPDFKSHFHSVEQSLVLDIGVLALSVHREAVLTFTKYLQYLCQKIVHRDMWVVLPELSKLDFFLPVTESNDPPIPQGATKFSYSTHITELRVKLCDTEFEFLELKIGGFETDCMFKANERMVLRSYLSYLTLDDLSEVTLYPKLISLDEDKVFELKYVRHSPRLYKSGGLGSNLDDVSSDGSLKLNLARIHVVFIYKMILDIQQFTEPLLPVALMWQCTGFLRRTFSSQLNQLRGWSTKLHLSLSLHLPVLLIPQSGVSPNLVICNLGELNVENFFKEVSSKSGSAEENPVVDNILLKLEFAFLSRGLMTLAGSLEIQEEVLEPIHIRFDIKRFVGGTAAMIRIGKTGKCQDVPIYEISGNLEPVKIAIGQRDLATFLGVWNENLSDAKFLETSWWWRAACSLDIRTPTETDEVLLRQLQVFLSHSDVCRKDTIARFTIDSITINLYNDIDEILSSPVRDLNRGLCRLTLWEASFFLEKNYDSSMDAKMALQNCLLEDIRTDSSVVIRKVFQSHHAGESKLISTISVSTPPIVDATYKQTPTGDRCIDILVEKTRLNLSVSFVGAVAKFIFDSAPRDKNEGGFINHGYDGDTGHQQRIPETVKVERPAGSPDSTSGYYSSGLSCTADEQSGLSVSLQFRKPELMIFASGEKKTRAILFRCEVLVDWSKHPGRDALVLSLASLQAFSKTHPVMPRMKQDSSIILHQCDVEVARNMKSMDDGLKMAVIVSLIDIKLSVTTVATIADIANELHGALCQGDKRTPIPGYQSITDLEDLWSPKKIISFCDADTCVANEPLLSEQSSFPVGKPAESLTVSVPKIRILVEVEHGTVERPLFLASSSFSLVAHDWSSLLNLRGEIHLQAAYLNENVGAWEPFIEPCRNNENSYRPWEIVFQVFQGKSLPISPHSDYHKDNGNTRADKIPSQVDQQEDSETSGDESDHGMTFLRLHNFDHALESRRHNDALRCGDSSDSENEDGALQKLTSAVGHLFTGDSSDGELSESGDSSNSEEEIEEDEGETEDETGSARSTTQERAVFLKKHSDSIDSGLETEAVERLATHVLIHSRDRLEMSITPAALKVLEELTDSFSGAPSIPGSGLTAPLTVVNSIGPGSVVTLRNKSETVPGGEIFIVSSYDRDESPPSSPDSPPSVATPTSPDSDADFESFDMIHRRQGSLSPILQFPQESISKLYNRLTDSRLVIQVPGFNDLKVVAPKSACSKLHTLQPSRNQTRYHVVVSTQYHFGRKKYTVRGPLQLRNETSYAIGIYYKKSVLEALGEKTVGEAKNPFEDMVRLAVVEPEDTLDVPLFIAYHCKLHILPAHVDHHISDAGISWQDMISDSGAAKDISCSSMQHNDGTVFSVRAICEENLSLNHSPRLLPNCLIRLKPPLEVYNMLPYAVELKLPQIKLEVRVEAGDKTNIYFVNLLKIQKITVEIPEYLGIPWVGTFNLTSDLEEKILMMATEQDTEGGNKQLGLSLRVTRNPTVNIYLHSPYWIINKTGLPLQIRGSLSDFIHEWTGEGPLLFCYRKQRRRCVRLRAFSSSWSSAFSLDTVGCSGLVICKDRERKRRYRILVHSHLSQLCPQLTRIISFLPNFIVTNECKKHLRFMEDNERADLWIDIAPGQCLPFWPETDSMRMFVKFRDSKHISQHFPVTLVHVTVLRMDKGCGLTVDVCGGGDEPFSVRFRNYQHGDAPVRIDNRCEDLFLKFHQKELGQVALLSPYQSLLYTWDDPSKERSLLWNVYNNKGKEFCVPFWKDGFGEERVSFHTVRQPQSGAALHETVTAKLSAGLKRLTPKSPPAEDSSSSDDSDDESQKPQLAKKTRRDKVVVYWASYLDGRQRVLLLTQNERVAKRARRAIDAERSHLELFVSLSGVGLSLINNDKQGKPRELTYCSLSDSAAQWEVVVANRWKPLALELASWLEDKYKQGLNKTQIKDYIHIDFDKMQMTKPFFGELRRKHRPALWVQYRKSKHMSLLHVQLHRVQIDNQLHDAQFPTILFPVPAPPSSTRHYPKPAVEFALLKKYSFSCNDVYKFAKVIVQEHSIQLERSWLAEMYRLSASWWQEENSCSRLRQDLALVHLPVSAIGSKRSRGSEQENMVEYLHCSPIKLQISFSPQNGHEFKETFRSSLVDYFLSTLSPSLTEIKSIKIKLLYFEIRGQSCSNNSIWDKAVRHFRSQLLQQLHVLVMGIDVLASPYSQVLDFSDGYHPFFYEPYLENIGIPEEFSEGLSSGALSLLGHEVGGPAGAATLLAASLGTALQAVIPHEDNWRRKSFFYSGTANDFPDSLVQSSNFASGCALGLSGVVLKPNLGNGPLHGPESFFRGPGKGLMGLMTKPTCGIFDCLSMATDGIRRAAEMGENVVCRIRPPRFVNPILGLLPYCSYEARGLALQQTLCRGLYCKEVYWSHAALTPDSKSILLITLQHVFLLEKCRAWTTYEPAWTLKMDDLMSVPQIENNKLVFSVRQEENLNTIWNEEKSAYSDDPALLQWLKNRAEAALVLSMEGKPCA